VLWGKHCIESGMVLAEESANRDLFRKRVLNVGKTLSVKHLESCM